MLSTCVWLWVRAWKSGETELPPPTSNSTNKGFLASHRPTSFSLHTRWGVEQSRMNIPTIICRCHIFKLKKALNLISFLCFAFHPGKVCSSRTAHHHCVSPCTSGAGVFCSHWQSSHLSVYITSIMICAPPHTHTLIWGWKRNTIWNKRENKGCWGTESRVSWATLWEDSRNTMFTGSKGHWPRLRPCGLKLEQPLSPGCCGVPFLLQHTPHPFHYTDLK